MKNDVPGICPICGSRLTVTELCCNKCDTQLKGSFELNKFTYLTKEERQFAELFIKCQGNLKELGSELGLSYPTVKKMLDNLVCSLGYDLPDEKRMSESEVLEKVRSGEISVEDAVNYFQKGASL